MKKRYYILGVMTLGCWAAPIQAQTQPQDTTVNRTVVVEQEYNPVVRDAAKVNVLPRVEPLTVSKKEVEYDASLQPSQQIPASPMQAFTGKEEQAKATPGYLRAGYGNLGNLDVRAHYLFNLSDRDKLNIAFDMDGRDGKIQSVEENQKWDSRYYRTQAHIGYMHQFQNGDLNIGGNFGLSNFNFAPIHVLKKQKFTSGDFKIGYQCKKNEQLLQIAASTQVMLYERQHDLMSLTPLKETRIHTQLCGTGRINDNHRVQLAVALNNVLYNEVTQPEEVTSLVELQNYTALDFNPAYLIDYNNWQIRLGAHIDLAFGFGKEFRIAPDVKAQYSFGNHRLYAQASGGKQLNDFRRLEQLSPYGLLNNVQLDATYEQLNAGIGFKTSPINGLWLHLFGGFQCLKNDLYYPEHSFAQTETKNLYGGLEIDYDYRNFFGIGASGVYRNWDSDGEEFTLYLKPKFEADVHAMLRPIAPLQISIGYQYAKREGAQLVSDQIIAPNDVSNLYAQVSYNLLDNLSIYGRFNNLLSSDYEIFYMHNAQGASALAGISFRF